MTVVVEDDGNCVGCGGFDCVVADVAIASFEEGTGGFVVGIGGGGGGAAADDDDNVVDVFVAAVTSFDKSSCSCFFIFW